MKQIFVLVLLAGMISCSNYDNNNNEELVALVGDKILSKSDLPAPLTTGLSAEDSAKITRTYIQKWVKKQLLLQKAELNLSNMEQREINRQLEETRSSLIIFQYEKQMIKQKLDTIIQELEIEDYYNENLANFVLGENIIKALFVKIPIDAPNISRVSNWYRSEDDEDLTQLESYCYQFAEKYDYFDEDWIEFNNLLKEIPVVINDHERYLKYNTNIETNDSSYYYFVNIREYRLKSTIAPVEFVQENIKAIILNNRKIQFLMELENKIFNDALTREEFKIY